MNSNIWRTIFLSFPQYYNKGLNNTVKHNLFTFVIPCFCCKNYSKTLTWNKTIILRLLASPTPLIDVLRLSKLKFASKMIGLSLTSCVLSDVSSFCNLSTKNYYMFSVAQDFFHIIIQIFLTIWEYFQILFKVLQLVATFLPILVLYPATVLCSKFKEYWYQLFIFGLEFSGPIFVKLGQWASTRRDLFPEHFCSYLSKLQRNTSPHSWYYTEKTLERAFGTNWKEIFVNFDKISIGSGCCAQVYKAWIRPETLSTDKAYKHQSENSIFIELLEMTKITHLFRTQNESDYGTESGELIPVAVKVLHPRTQTMLHRDLFIMKMTAVLLTTLFPSLKWLSLEDCVKDFTQMMKAQVDFTIEAHNLDKFSDNFKHISTVKFPRPIWPLTHPFLLVETFEEGHPMQDYVVLKDRQEEIHTKLAEVGINTILKMVFEDNFAHGDLHPGNMLVQDIPDSQVKKTTNKRKWFGKLQGSQSPPFHLVILDCGIVSSLDERGKICLKEVFSAVANKDGARVAQLFLEHSNHQCSDTDSFKQQMIEIVDSAVSKNVTLEQVEVSDLLSTLFSAVINHKVKLDGSFSSVILAIMILEGLGRSLDPTIDIVEKAKPFLFSAM